MQLCCTERAMSTQTNKDTTSEDGADNKITDMLEAEYQAGSH